MALTARSRCTRKYYKLLRVQIKVDIQVLIRKNGRLQVLRW